MINLTPRQVWFQNRINECIEELKQLNGAQDWISFKINDYELACELACELIYATTEWDKYYKDINEEME